MKRKGHELPEVIEKNGWQYHHLGIPYTHPRPEEQYLAALKIYVSGFKTSPYGIEWMRFEPGSAVPKIVKTLPHLAFVVDDLEEALAGRKVIVPPNSPSPGVRVAMIVHDQVPIELMEFNTRKRRRK